MPSPEYLNVSSSAMRVTIRMSADRAPVFNVTGFVLSQNGTPLQGATVLDTVTGSSSYSSVNGYYSVGGASYGGENSIVAYKPGYGEGAAPPLFVTSNMTDVNITLYPGGNPFYGSATGSGSGWAAFSGSNASQAGNVSSYLSGHQSDVSAGGDFINATLYGYIKDTNNSMPVGYTNLSFVAEIAGKTYFEDVETNSTGFYAIGISEMGNYTIAVVNRSYAQEFVNVDMRGNLELNLSLTPYNQFVQSFTVKVYNGVDRLPVSPVNASFSYEPYSPPFKSVPVNYTSPPSFRFYAVPGQYTVRVWSPGYQADYVNVTTGHSYTVYLEPASSIAASSFIWNGSYTGVPGIYPVQVSDNASSQSPASSPGGNSTVYIRLYNASSGQALANTPFILFLGTSGGEIYQLNGNTNSSGEFPIHFYYSGTFRAYALSGLRIGGGVQHKLAFRRSAGTYVPEDPAHTVCGRVQQLPCEVQW
ncbi:hypothetical protein [Thermogymnomonas acidicola]|uniref:carboxypeptidase-like regulatory domain-containing protein n=1 Tax=Thermogymnomonas acidicola TaxID=399579 RepID=UPI00094647AA|nr:carboxypeptidase-like regulatory domain-containing protein [Thermogymnomonas acidicola]